MDARSFPPPRDPLCNELVRQLRHCAPKPDVNFAIIS